MGYFSRINTHLSYRIAFVASLLAGAFIVALGGASYWVMRAQMASSIDDVIEQNAVMRAEHVHGLLASIVSTLSSLAGNSLVANALVDSAGRDVYLIPFVQDLTQINGVPILSMVTDFEGKLLASSAEGVEATFAYSAIARQVVETESPSAIIQASTDGDILILAEPIVHPMTESAEGAMILKLAVKSLLLGDPYESVTGDAKSGRLLYTNLVGDEMVPAVNRQGEVDGADATLKVVQPINVANYLKPLGLAVEITSDQHILTQPLQKLSVIYLGLGIITILAVLILSLAAGRHLARPIRELEEVARSVIASGSSDHRFSPRGVDEVARLGELFNRMLQRLGEAYAISERQASALRESEQRYRAIFDTTTAPILEVDISSMRAAIEKLRRQEDWNLNAYLAQRPETLQEWLEQTVIVNGNPATRQVFDVELPGELAGSLERLFPLESQPVLMDLVVAIGEQRSSFSTETRIQTPLGQQRDALLGAYIGVQPGHMLLSIVDITERKAAEQQVRQTNKLLHAIGEAQDAYITATGERTESEAFDRLLDSLLESTDSKYGFIGEVHHIEDGRPYLRTHAITNIAWNEESRELFEKLGPRGFEFFNLDTLFGAVITSEQPVIANQPATDPRAGGLPPGHPPLDAFFGIPFIFEGNLVGMAGIANRTGGYDDQVLEDMQPVIATCTSLIQAMRTDRRRLQSEHQLAQEQQRLNTVLETAPLILWAFDLEGQFLLSRGKGLNALGLKPDEVVGKSVFELYADVPEVIEASRRALGGETVQASTYVAERWFDVRYEPMRDEAGNLQGCVGAALDVTRQVEAEQQLQRYRRELEYQVQQRTEAYEETKRYAYIFSHDLRGPLVSAKGFVGELRLDLEELRETASSLTDASRDPGAERLLTLTQESIPEALGFIESSVDKIDTLTSALLELSRAGSKEFHFEAVDMRALIDNALQAFAYQIEKENIRVEVAELPSVWADRSAMAQVIDNLLRNAINYRKPDVQGNITITAEPQDNQVIFRLKDNGIGVSKKDLTRIFEPFRRIESTTTAGDGMGLTFVQTLIRRMGGRIWCESEPGGGCTFSFTVPDRTTQPVEVNRL